MNVNLISPSPFINPVVPVILPRILALDDDADMLGLYTNALTDAGYGVDTLPDGEAGWDALCTTEYDLLLTDSQMPRLTGLELIARLRAAGINLPVILSCGSRRSGQIGDGRWLGLASVLYKPFTPVELVDAIRHSIPSRLVTAGGFSRQKEIFSIDGEQNQRVSLA